MTVQRVTKEVRGRGPLSLRERFRAQARHSRVPVKAQIELTTRCSLRCVHCYIGNHDRPELPLARVIELVDELADAGCMVVGLTGGELALRGGWLDVAGRVRQRGMLLSILTSGTSFSADDLKELIVLRPARVSVSLYGSTAPLHESVTRVEGSFAGSLATLRQLAAAGVPCRVSSVLMPQNIHDFRAIAALAEGLGAEFVFDPTVAPRDDGSSDVTDFRIEPQRLKEFYLSGIIASRSRPGQLATASQAPGRLPPANCDAGFSTVFVDAQGEVYPCMGFPPSFGGLSGASFREVWLGSIAEAHRGAMERPLHGCDRCDIAGYCRSRCARLAAVEDGDLSGPSSWACKITAITVEMREQLLGAT